jgi:hypothetical protein
VSAQSVRDLSEFDIVLALRLIRHLDDGEARDLFRMGYGALRPGGRLATMDGCYTEDQSNWTQYYDWGRLVRPREFLGKETFMVTYGDGLANINIADLVRFHRQYERRATITAVSPVARFGSLQLARSRPQTDAHRNPVDSVESRSWRAYRNC